MLIAIEELRAQFSRLEEEDFSALVALRLIDKHTTTDSAKSLSFALKRDAVVKERRASMWIAAQDKARAENPEPEWEDDSAWYHIGDDEFTALDVIEAMSKEERAELRARIG